MHKRQRKIILLLRCKLLNNPDQNLPFLMRVFWFVAHRCLENW
jgi:hypothetical protein